MLLQYL